MSARSDAPLWTIVAIAIAVTAAAGGASAAVVWQSRAGTSAVTPSPLSSNSPAALPSLPAVRVYKALTIAAVQVAQSVGKIDDFDVDENGHAVVRSGGDLFDAGSGTKLNDAAVASSAFYRGALAVISGSGDFGYLGDQGITTPASAQLGNVTLQSASDGQSLFFLRNSTPYELASLDAQGMHTLTETPAQIDAIGGTYDRHFFSIANDLFFQQGDKRPELLLHLPSDQPVLGIALVAGSIYFSTPHGVYTIQTSLALPVELGLGGRLHATPDGLMVLDRGSGRLFTLRRKS